MASNAVGEQWYNRCRLSVIYLALKAGRKSFGENYMYEILPSRHSRGEHTVPFYTLSSQRLFQISQSHPNKPLIISFWLHNRQYFCSLLLAGFELIRQIDYPLQDALVGLRFGKSVEVWHNSADLLTAAVG